MSRMLTLNHMGWSAVQSLVRQGRRHEALVLVERWLDRIDLPRTTQAEAHRLAAELLIEREQYAKARLHLRDALRLEPNVARTYDLMGRAFESDPQGDDRKAALCYRRACRLDPENVLYRAQFGRAAIRCDRIAAGVMAMRSAAQAAPGNIPVVRLVVEGMLEADRVDTARRVLMKARFLCPGNRELAALENRVRFEQARTQQNTRKPQEARFATEGDVALLPFVRVVRTESGTATHGTLRRDVISFARPHFPRLRMSNADR